MAEYRHHRTQRDHGECHDRRDHRDDRCQKINRLVDAGGCQAFLESEFDAVGQRLQQSERTDPVGSVPHLHTTQQFALDEDGHQGGQEQEGEDRDRLHQNQPPRVMAEYGRIRVRLHRAPPVVMCTTAPVVTPSWLCTALPGEFSGSHTTPSGIAVTASGTVTDPRPVVTVTG